MVHFILTIALFCFVVVSQISPAKAQPFLPEVRYHVLADTDYYGSDLQTLFDTDLKSCQRACTTQMACVGFSFNSRSNACFPKSEMTEGSDFQGALSALKISVPPALEQAAAARAARLSSLPAQDFAAALGLANSLALRYRSRGQEVEALLRAGRDLAQANNPRAALPWIGAALVRTDDPDLWREMADLWRAVASDEANQTARTLQEQALSAALNSYLRAPSRVDQRRALTTAALSLQELERGRDMLAVLRLANALSPHPKTKQMLEEATEAYGFRVTDSTVESNSADPRICVEFSEDLKRSDVDFNDYVQSAAQGLSVAVQDRELCIEGLEHGQRYRVALRAGLPAANGDSLSGNVEITHYVRDRVPSLRFPGRAYVLAKSDTAALPINSVNLPRVELRLRRISDRNLLRSMQEDLFGQPLSRWQEEYLSEQIAEDIWSGEAELSQSLNQDVTTRLPLASVLAEQPVGIYALTARIPGADPYQDGATATQWFVLTDLGVSSMSGTDGLHVQVQSLTTAQPRAGITLSLISVSNAVLGRAETDETGHAQFAPGLIRGQGGAAPALITAEEGAQDFAFLSLRDAAFDLSDRGVEGRQSPGPVDVFLTTDRGAYRAGETAHVTALTRDSRALAIADLPLIVILKRPDGVEYSRHISRGGQAGGHVFSLPIGASAPRGTWRLDLKADPDAPVLASKKILVEDFLPERIDFDQALKGELTPGGNATLDLRAEYLFGAPGTGLEVEGDLRLRPSGMLEDWPGYHFGRHDVLGSVSREYFGGTETGSDGRAEIAVTLPTTSTTGKPMQLEVVTRVLDGSARPVERVLTQPVQPASPVIGIKPLFADVVAEGAEAGFELIALAPDLKPRPMHVKWTLNRLETRYQWYQLYGNWNWEPITRRSRIATGEVTLGAAPLRLDQPVNWGEYELVIEGLDGAPVAATHRFFAGWFVPADETASPDRLQMSLDAQTYVPGDTAQLRLVPPAAGTALISVLSNQVIERHVVEVPAGETVIPLQVTRDWGSGAYVTATVLQPVSGRQSRAPVRTLGIAHANVTQPGQALEVRIDVPKVAQPRQTQLARVAVEGAGAGDEVWLTLSAVDLGILNLTGFQSPDPRGHYHGQKRLGVELRDIYGRLIDPGTGALGVIRSGGDADQGLRRQSPPPTQDLMAVFSGAVKLGADGSAVVPIDLPAFNGTVRLMAVAWSERAVGQAEQDMIVRDPVVVSATLPRFLAPGDRSRARIEVTHAEGPAGTMAITARALGTGVELGALPTSVTLSEKETVRLDLPITAQAVGDPEVELTLTTPDGVRLVQVLRIPVRSNDPVVATTQRFTLSGGDSFLFSKDVFAGLKPGTGRALVSAGPLARFDVPGLLSELDQYPFGCTEQVTSKALPLLYLSSVAEAAGLGARPDLEARITDAIRKVLTRQTPEGGFGLWRAESGDIWLDAYASDFLARARRTGHPVPDQAFAQAMENLRNRVNYTSSVEEGGSALAYALLVLAREGAADMGDLRYYADVKAAEFSAPLAAAQLGAALAAYGDQVRADRMFAQAGNLLDNLGVETAIWRADYGTHRRDAAAILALATEARTTVVNRDYLSARITSDTARMSTQEATWTLLAAQSLVAEPEASGLLVNGQPVSGAFVDMREDGSLDDGFAISAASGRQEQLTLTTFGVPEIAPEAGGFGYSITRSYYTLEGAPLGVTDLRVGQRFVTVLELRPHEKVGARLMINDPLPAGVEIDNPNLLRSGDLQDLAWLDLDSAEHAEFRSDRFLAAVDLRGTETVTLAYVARAVTQGSFHHPAATVEDMYRPAYRAHTATGRIDVR